MEDPGEVARRIRDALRQALPDYMGVQSLVRLDALPLTPNGKLDAGALPPVIHHEDGCNADEAVRLSHVRNLYRRMALGAADAMVVPSHRLETIATRAWKLT